MVVTLVATKSDLVQSNPSKREVTPEEIDAFCKEHGNLTYIETSSKTGDNVEEVSLVILSCNTMFCF